MIRITTHDDTDDDGDSGYDDDDKGNDRTMTTKFFKKIFPVYPGFENPFP